MNVILLNRIENLGHLGDEVAVRAGYARNYLIPFGFAVPATREHRERFEERRAQLEQEAADALAQAQSESEKLSEVRLTIRAKAGPEGKLYGSIGSSEISEELNRLGFKVVKRQVLLAEGSIRKLGNYKMQIRLHPNVTVELDAEVSAN